MSQYSDLYNYNDQGAFNSTSQDGVDDLVKAMSATHQTGRELDGLNTSGASLKVENLDPTVKVLTNTDKWIKFWKVLPKEKSYQTVQEVNKLVDYGLEGTSLFNGEAETPQFTDSIYKRDSVLIKYMGVSGEVTDQMMLSRIQDGVGNMLATEVKNKTQFLLRGIDRSIVTANSSMVDYEFDGYYKQHFDGIAGGNLDTYANSDNVIDARGSVLKDEFIEDAVSAVVDQGYGDVSHIVSNPTVFNNYAKNFLGDKRVMVNNPTDATTGATMGQRVANIAAQSAPEGTVDILSDTFFDRPSFKYYNSAATDPKAPAKPTKDGSTPIAVVTDTNTKFTDGASTYWYLVTSRNRYGESTVELINTSGQAVTATQAVNLKFAQTDNAYASESFSIYRTEAGVTDYTTAKFYKILEVNKTELAAGYDGGAAGLVRDRNRTIPNTSSALVLSINPETLNIYQFAPIRRFDLAFTSLSHRFSIVSYLSPAIFAPKKITKITNIGKTTS